MVKWLNPRQYSLTGRGIIMGAIDGVYDLIRVKLKFFYACPLMDAVATPSCSQPQCVDLKNQIWAVEKARSALITGTQPHVD